MLEIKGLEKNSISARQLQRLMAQAKKLKEQLEDREKMLQAVKEYMTHRWNVNFNSEGQIYGKWKGLSQSWTVIERGSSHPILIRTGKHFAEFVRQNDAGVVSNQAVTWNFESKQDAWLVAHHLGIRNPIPNRDDIGPRILWDVNDEDEEEIREIVEDEVEITIETIFKDRQV